MNQRSDVHPEALTDWREINRVWIETIAECDSGGIKKTEVVAVCAPWQVRCQNQSMQDCYPTEDHENRHTCQQMSCAVVNRLDERVVLAFAIHRKVADRLPRFMPAQPIPKPRTSR